jgi:N-hydroxyarylamine O-acetyltransferase
MHIDRYLERIRARSVDSASLDALRRLHRCHLWTVPFENIDVALGRPIDLSLPALYDKIVRRGRGGFCYELNGLFAWALEQLGFRVSRLAGRVFTDGAPGPPFDHLLLLVELGERWVADVGFGDSFVDPLPLHGSGRARSRFNRAYRLEPSGGEWILWRIARGDAWTPQYSFSLEPHALEEFAPMCHYHQTSPASVFTRKTVCSLATPSGRRTVTNSRLITTDRGRRVERDISGSDEYLAVLREWFGISLPESRDVHKLMGGHGLSKPV